MISANNMNSSKSKKVFIILKSRLSTSSRMNYGFWALLTIAYQNYKRFS